MTSVSRRGLLKWGLLAPGPVVAPLLIARPARADDSIASKEWASFSLSTELLMVDTYRNAHDRQSSSSPNAPLVALLQSGRQHCQDHATALKKGGASAPVRTYTYAAGALDNEAAILKLMTALEATLAGFQADSAGALDRQDLVGVAGAIGASHAEHLTLLNRLRSPDAEEPSQVAPIPLDRARTVINSLVPGA
jgi:hypothetical protein